ncbi:CoA transferase [Dactylosporangium sp. NPDC051484]|uniref:CaiB/BaiF CoA transferase family protein n=1 Tax=Dactylosporangium sp. NPDC051484 TaxID=3154942 RepID=UPI00344B26AB
MLGSADDNCEALSGLRVLDLSRVLAGPYCTQMLGDHGATVIKVEGPAGDETRTFGPYLRDGRSAYFEALNRNKRNICLDLSSDAGRAVLWDLLETADVVVENFKVGTMAKWGFSYEEVLADRYPKLIYCQITGFGVDGPLGGMPGYDAALQAYGGLMSVNGEADGQPLRIGVPIVDIVTGLHAFSGILLALNERARSGLGQLVDCTLIDTAISLLMPHSSGWLGTGALPVRTGGAHPGIAPYESFATRSGPIFIGAANDRQFTVLCEVLGAHELAEAADYRSNRDRLANVVALRSALRALIAPWRAEALSETLLERGVAASPVNTVADALLSAQAQHRSMVVTLPEYQGVGIPIKLSRTPGSVRSAPAARGADSDVIKDQLDIRCTGSV